MIETNDKILIDKWYDMIENNEIHGKQVTYTAQDFRTRDGRTTVYCAYVYYVEELGKYGKYVAELLREHTNWTETIYVNFYDTEYEAKREALEWLWYQI